MLLWLCSDYAVQPEGARAEQSTKYLRTHMDDTLFHFKQL